MTTGTKTSGSRIQVATDVGSSYIMAGYTQKSWSGSDYPNTDRSDVKPNQFTHRTILVRRGKEVYEYLQPIRLHISDRPPKRALVVEHPYEMSVSVQTDSVLMFQTLDYGIWGPLRTGTCANTSLGGGSVSQSWGSNDDIALLGRLREKVAGSSFNAGVFLGEGREALSMISNAAIRLAGAIRNAKRGNLPKALSILTRGTDRFVPPSKVGANNWLELQYGWLPLLHDMEDGAKFLAHHHSYPLQHVVYARLAKPGTVNSVSTLSKLGSRKAYTSVQIKAILKEKDTVSLLGLNDVASLAWELLPYSFVVDWAIPIGEYLQARGLARSLSGTFVTSKKEYSHWGDPIYVDSPTTRVTFGSHSATSVQLKRTVSTTLSVPLPEVVPLSKMLSWKRATNALALLVSANK